MQSNHYTVNSQPYTYRSVTVRSKWQCCLPWSSLHKLHVSLYYSSITVLNIIPTRNTICTVQSGPRLAAIIEAFTVVTLCGLRTEEGALALMSCRVKVCIWSSTRRRWRWSIHRTSACLTFNRYSQSVSGESAVTTAGNPYAHPVFYINLIDFTSQYCQHWPPWSPFSNTWWSVGAYIERYVNLWTTQFCSLWTLCLVWSATDPACISRHTQTVSEFRAHLRQYCFVQPRGHDLALSWLFRPLEQRENINLLTYLLTVFMYSKNGTI